MKKILICDDEEGIRESLKLILSEHYELIVTTGGQQAVECVIHDQSIGLVLLDIKMPQFSGLDVLEEIKKKRNVPVIMVTGYNSVETAAEASHRGANGYIVKPFKSDEILEAVKKHIG